MEKNLESAALHAEYACVLPHPAKEFTAAHHDTIRRSHTHGAAYDQAFEEFVSEIMSDFMSGAALSVSKALRQAQLKLTTRAQV